MYKDSWNVMRSGDTRKAIGQMRANFDEDPDASSIMELGTAFLWLQDYEAAWKHFDVANQKQPLYSSPFYSMAGVAKWCLGDSNEAVNQWLIGIDCEYSDDTQLQIPLNLYFAGVVKPSTFDTRNAMSLLEERSSMVTFNRWPLPLVKFILGNISETEVRRQCFDERFVDETLLHHWQADFYLGVQKLAQGDSPGFHDLMRATGDFLWVEFDEYKRLVYSKLWSPEFFLARYEADLR